VAMRVSIIGLGLIGGSLGLALRGVGDVGAFVTGYVRRPELGSRALSMGAVDSVKTELSEAVKGAGIVVVATPVLTIRDILVEVAEHLAPGCIVTDTASTKAEVVKWAMEVLPPQVSFVPGHPMAGKETYGISAATPDLFKGCTYCLVPGNKASTEAMERIVELVHMLGARPFFVEAEEHDRLVAGISHLPMLLSAVLVSATTGNPSWDRMSRLAASGYRGLSRLASGSPRVNGDICLSNREAILEWMDEFSREFERYRRLLMNGETGIVEVLADANRAREEWLESRRREESEPATS